MNDEKVSKLIKYVIKRFYKNHMQYHEDMYQAGYIGYLNALNNYKEGLGPIRLIYLITHIRKEISNCLKELNNFQEMNCGIEARDDRVTDYAQKEEIRTVFKTCKSKLDDKEAYIIENMYLINEMTQSEIAHELGVSQQRVSQLKDSALTKMKNFFTDFENVL